MTFIDETGEVQVSFDQKMRVLPKLSMIDEGVVHVKGIEQPVLKIEVEASSDSNPADLGFRWETSAMTVNYVRFKLHFSKAKFVSAQEEPDMLKITIYDRYIFVSNMDLAIKVSGNKARGSSGRLLSSEADEQ